MMFKQLFSGMMLAALACIHSSYASEDNQANNSVNEVNLVQQSTDDELAAIYVMSEFCPSLLEPNQQEGFAKGYQQLVEEYLPEQQQAVSYLKLLSGQKSFEAVLKQAKSDVEQAGDLKNVEICRDLVTYYK